MPGTGNSAVCAFDDCVLSTGEGTSFEAGYACDFDGVTDCILPSGDSLTCFNPFNDVDYKVSFFAKSTSSRFKHNGTVISVGQTTTQNPRFSIKFINDGGSNSKLVIISNLMSATSTYSITPAVCQSWNHYMIVVTQGATQTIEIYINNVLVDTLTPSTYTITDSSVSLQIGSSKGSSAFNVFEGRLAEISLGVGSTSAQEIADLYNQNDPQTSMNGIVNYYKFSEPVGTVVGNITDSMGSDDLTMSGFALPNGIVSDQPF